jgi:hypothetical protein
MTSPNFTSYDEYIRMTALIDACMNNNELTIELFGHKDFQKTTKQNEQALTEFLRTVYTGFESKKRTNFRATMIFQDKVLFSGLFNFTCFHNFALLLWHSASHANVTLKNELKFEVEEVDSLDQSSTSYKSPYCWE